jgi:hypothetical protein
MVGSHSLSTSIPKLHLYLKGCPFISKNNNVFTYKKFYTQKMCIKFLNYNYFIKFDRSSSNISTVVLDLIIFHLFSIISASFCNSFIESIVKE